MKKNNLLLFVIVLLLLIIVRNLLNVGSSTKTTLSRKTVVSASFYPLYFFTKEIAGDTVEVINITPAGSEPHDYDPTPQDIARIEKSKLLILNGGGLESWADKMKENLKGKNVLIITAGENVISRDFQEEGKTIKDPHLWLSPKLAKSEVEVITQGLIIINPERTSFYQAHAKKLTDALDTLDDTYKEGLKNCKQKDIITSHAAFAYLVQAYGLNQVPISGLTPDEEPSPGKLAQVAKFAKENNIQYIFFESLVSPKLSETIAKELGVKTLVLNPLEGLTDEEIQKGKNYISIMEENLSNLRLALQCQ